MSRSIRVQSDKPKLCELSHEQIAEMIGVTPQSLPFVVARGKQSGHRGILDAIMELVLDAYDASTNDTKDAFERGEAAAVALVFSDAGITDPLMSSLQNMLPDALEPPFSECTRYWISFTLSQWLNLY